MSLATAVTAEDLLEMPDDGVERWIVDGELREGGMTIRNQFHSETLTLVVYSLQSWLRTQPKPRGRVYCGEAGVRLRNDPELTVGIDALYVDPALSANLPKSASTIIEGVPVLAVEILSPSDTQEGIDEKIDLYLEAGVKVVWSINPKRRTVTVYRPNRKPKFYTDDQELTGEPELPGYKAQVLSFFEDLDP